MHEHKLLLKEEVDTLVNAPAEVPEEFPRQMKVEVSMEKAESQEIQKTVSKKYTNEDLYKMISLVLRYPSGGHGGETFWTWMVKIYGNSLLERRNGNGLRNRWRRILKKHPSDLDEYKKQLAATFPQTLIEDIEKRLLNPIVDVSHLGLSSRVYASLFPGLQRPADARDVGKGTRKRKLKNGNAEVVVEERRKIKKASAKSCIDLGALILKPGFGLSKLIVDTDVTGIETAIILAKGLMITRDLKKNTSTVKAINMTPFTEKIPSYKKVDVRRCDLLRNCTSKRGMGWSELEDLVLRHPENVELNDCLIRIKGAVDIDKRKKLLALI